MTVPKEKSQAAKTYAFVSLGAKAPPASVRLLEATLDSLRVAAR